MRHIIVLMHGIETPPSVRDWTEEFAIRMRAPGLEFIPRKYGYVPGWRINYFSSYRRRIVEHERDYFTKLRTDIGTPEEARISVICHSLGGYIVHQLMQNVNFTSEGAGITPAYTQVPGFKFHRVIELYGAGDENEGWTAIEANFGQVYVYWSPNDEILPRSNFGQIGLVGPTYTHPRVFPIQTTDRHNDFMEDARQYADAPTYIRQLTGE